MTDELEPDEEPTPVEMQEYQRKFRVAKIIEDTRALLREGKRR